MLDLINQLLTSRVTLEEKKNKHVPPKKKRTFLHNNNCNDLQLYLNGKFETKQKKRQVLKKL